MRPATVNLAGGRWVPLVHEIEVQGVDLTGAVLAAQVRLTPDASGAALVDLLQVTTAAAQGVMLVYAGTDTIANHIAATRLSEIPEGMATSDSLALTVIGIRVNETVMEAMLFPGERGDDVALSWDMHITPAGGNKQVWFEGSFVVEAGVTA